jgi:hypothetical protein
VPLLHNVNRGFNASERAELRAEQQPAIFGQVPPSQQRASRQEQRLLPLTSSTASGGVLMERERSLGRDPRSARPAFWAELDLLQYLEPGELSTNVHAQRVTEPSKPKERERRRRPTVRIVLWWLRHDENATNDKERSRALRSDERGGEPSSDDQVEASAQLFGTSGHLRPLRDDLDPVLPTKRGHVLSKQPAPLGAPVEKGPTGRSGQAGDDKPRQAATAAKIEKPLRGGPGIAEAAMRVARGGEEAGGVLRLRFERTRADSTPSLRAPKNLEEERRRLPGDLGELRRRRNLRRFEERRGG